MHTRNKFRLKQLAARNGSALYQACGSMRGSVKILGDIVGPVWDGGPWDAELGIAYRGENAEPVYYTGNGTETTDDLN